MLTSLFDLFKIGIGPSSSHTVGPMRAALRFAQRLETGGHLEPAARLLIDLYGSLALTGEGHGTDRGILLGLMGQQPDQVDPAAIAGTMDALHRDRTLNVLGRHSIAFDPTADLIFHKDQTLSRHSNGMRFTAFAADGAVLDSGVYYSTGGGFVAEEGASTEGRERGPVPYPFTSAHDLLHLGHSYNLAIHQIMLADESAWRPEEEVRAFIRRVWDVMQECVRRGLATEGTLPGGLNVRRRAPELARTLASPTLDPLSALDWLNLWAIAVSEENAAGGRVVTAPTNGAAGIIPAVAHYYARFLDGNDEGIERYFLAAAAIGVLYRENASIAGSEVGCQGEVGVACSMAAGGLAAALGGTNEQVEHAAEIAMEHNLGLTCDPVGGLVQIPCIERNAFGSVKAVNAARMAIHEHGGHKVSLDQVIRTMYQTGLDLQSRYKETSLGGLALNVIEC